jgi:DNA invertase Pin-like site-specific DNA recombinase
MFEEAAPGGSWDRAQLHRLLDQPRSGDTLVAWKLDRLSRSLKDLLPILERIDTAGGKSRSVTEAIHTVGPAGRLMMQMLGSLAEFEREMICERTRARLARSANESASWSRNQKSRSSNRKKSPEPCHPGARPRPRSLARSNFTALPFRGSFFWARARVFPPHVLRVTKPPAAVARE